MAYKRGVGDTRESPAHDVIAALRRRRAYIAYADPYVPAFQVGDIEFKAVQCTPEKLRQADCVVILADHPDFDYETIAREAPLIVDTRQVIPMSAAGARVVRI